MTTKRRPPRPRLLYAALFVFFAVTGGRFMAPFLEHEAGFSDTMVGSVLAAQVGVSSLLGSAGGTWADRRERSYPGKGRLQVMFLGVALGSLLFLLHGLCHLFPGISLLRSTEWHFGLRLLYACSSSLLAPVMDGLCLSHLDKDSSSNRSDYGKERLHGAIWWAIAYIIAGPLIDWFGFTVLYWAAMLSTVALFICIGVYAGGQEMLFEEDADESPATQENTQKTAKHQPHQIVPEIKTWTLLWIMLGTAYGVTFLFAFVCLSAGTSLVESLVFLFFEFLGGSSTLCGVTVALTVLFEIPIFHIAPELLRRFGAGTLQQIASVAYVIRVVGYTIIPQGHIAYVLLLEPLHGVTYACSKTSSVDFAAQLMPPGYEASGQGLLSLFQGLGSVVGLFLGGLMEDTFGPRNMYRSFAGVVLVGSVVFGVASLRRPPEDTAQHVIVPQTDDEHGELSLTMRRHGAKRKDSSLVIPDDDVEISTL